jgi:Co/Zn/Cd efflux system component
VSWFAVLLSGVFGSVIIWWSEFRRYDDSTIFLVVFIVNFLTLFGLAHPDLSFFSRYLVFFGYSDMNYSVVRSQRRYYFDGFLLIAIFVHERLSITGILCVCVIGILSLFVSITFPSNMFKSQRRLKIDLKSLVVALLSQIFFRRPVPRGLVLIALLLALPDRFPSLPKLTFPKLLGLFCAVSICLTVAEMIGAHRQRSAALTALSVRTLAMNLLSVASGVISPQQLSLQFSFGFARVRVVMSLAVVVFTLLASLHLISDSIRRLARPPFVEEHNIMLSAALFFAVDVFQLCQVAVLNLTEGTFRGVDCYSVIFWMFGSFTSVLSAFLIDKLEIYFVDALSEVTIAITLVDFVLPFLAEQVDALLVSSAQTDLKIVAGVLRQMGRARDFHVWNAKEDLNVATFRVDEKSGRVTEVIAELQKLKIRDITIEAAP